MQKIRIIIGSECFLRRDWIVTYEGREEIWLVVVKFFKTEKVILWSVWAFPRRWFGRE
jgi:hypothetical protein